MSKKADYHERHPFPDKKMQRTGSTFLCLKFARSFNREFEYSDLNFMNADKFPMGTGRGARTHRTDALIRLHEIGLLDNTSAGVYKINPEGSKYLTLVSQFYQRNPPRSASRAKQQTPHQ